MVDFISKPEMISYGYLWNGMIPIPEKLAKDIWLQGNLPVYRIYEDDTEGMIDEYEEFESHSQWNGMFGIEKDDLEKFLKQAKELETYMNKYEEDF